MSCPGPLVWFDVDTKRLELGAVLECTAPDCDYFIATGSFHDVEHLDCGLPRAGLA